MPHVVRLGRLKVGEGQPLAVITGPCGLEVHDSPSKAPSDGANSLGLKQFKPLMARLRELDDFVQKL
jgi:3-deoxy-D-manno-octulosonic acid (KDO) 8-phosphate synthase